MEVMELLDLRRAFLPSEDRYACPHTEAMRLRSLWTLDRRPGRSRDAQRVNELFAEAKKLVAEGSQHFTRAISLIRKGLLINPRYHSFYALRGDIFSYQGKLDEAVDNYEHARRMIIFDKRVSPSSGKSYYSRSLIEMYWKRGLRNHAAGRLLEAASDYEQILVLRPYGVIVTDIQIFITSASVCNSCPNFSNLDEMNTTRWSYLKDKLLETLRTLDKYDAYRYNWARFIREADQTRASALLTQHAEYMIFRREMGTARHILLEAIDLDGENAGARELLQVVYNTGHHLVAFAIIWTMYGCYDKALTTIEKGRDCDPNNPGYTLLKAIVLRLSGRLLQAANWLESVDKGFHKLSEPSMDTQGSVMGNLTIEQTRTQLIKQWYLIRYDIAVQFMIEGRYKDAMTILQSSELRRMYAETHLLMGDCMSKLGEPDVALGMYMNCLKKSKELKSWDVESRKNTMLLKRITDILNKKCNEAVEENRADDAIKIAEDVLRMIVENRGKDPTRLGQNEGEALICKARAEYKRDGVSRNSACCRSAAEGLKLTRGVDDRGLHRLIFNDTSTEQVIDRYGRKKELPHSLKLLMQYS